MKEEKYYLYSHKNKINGKVYVGITKQRANARWKNGEGYKSNPAFYFDIQKYGWNAFDHTIIKDNLSAEEAAKLEVEYIELLNAKRTKGGYNKTRGGETHAHVSEETRRKLSDALTGRKLSPETLKKRSETMKGHFVSEETRRKIGNRHRGKVASKELREKLKTSHKKEAKPVEMISADGEIIKRYASVHEASRQTNIQPVLIRNVCLKKQTETKGTIWRFADERG